jgi:hypothetical protein
MPDTITSQQYAEFEASHPRFTKKRQKFQSACGRGNARDVERKMDDFSRNYPVMFRAYCVRATGTVASAAELLSSQPAGRDKLLKLFNVTFEGGSYRTAFDIADKMGDERLKEKVVTAMLKKSRYGEAVELSKRMNDKNVKSQIFETAFWKILREKRYSEAVSIFGGNVTNLRIMFREMLRAGLDKEALAACGGSNHLRCTLAVEMIGAGKGKQDAARLARPAFIREYFPKDTSEEIPEEKKKITKQMLNMIIQSGCLEGLMAGLSKDQIHDAAKRISDNPKGVLFENSGFIVDKLLEFMKGKTEEVNSWNSWWKENYLRPNYEEALQIGEIAKAARQSGNTRLLNYIRSRALPRIEGMLNFANPRPGVDYGYVYVVYPMRKALLQAIVDIGDKSSIGAVKACGNIDYNSPYNDTFYSVKSEKKLAIDYLQKQAGTSKFIEPPELNTGD